ncbi:MAG: prepilin-type N-terminal cleavage/methylation domain-containing protein [Litorilituus sp.]|nr:prepilin-type N-terminal cleavage/methylation domain-containing protein [Litorilituus sp.]
MPFDLPPLCIHSNTTKQQGFTLIELLVVVSILAALAGITSVAMDGYQQDAEKKITRVEMQRIAGAIRRFKADTGYWPKTETADYNYQSDDAANFSFLFNKPDADMQDWSPEYAIGWHGPYIDLPAIRPIAIDNFNSDLGCSGNGNATHIATIQAVAEDRMNGLIDQFQQLRDKVTGEKYCVLTRDNDPSLYTVSKYSGSPYLYETAFEHADSKLCKEGTDTCIALRSFGPDGVDNGGSDESDDIVFVLQVNSELGE